ncbi:hypothetical protein [Enterovirga aerilata]|uniref:Uncharacterized protein n=1 Tax=Enterovirga aerilata TaxID=2730920 RepID=A0A849I8Y3_9HYPH|nr:hypothetical protein [Enterovirga sp. DB1703]NNM72457.1 hypothetical protein [Enterovirga sp. DB1703]
MKRADQSIRPLSEQAETTRKRWNGAGRNPSITVRQVEVAAEVAVGAQLRFPELTEEEILAFVAGNPWRFARTMPQYPHWYCLIEKVAEEDRLTFCRFARQIRRRGYRQRFRKRWQTYYDVGPDKFWVIGYGKLDDPRDVDDVILINRAPKGDAYP